MRALTLSPIERGAHRAQRHWRAALSALLGACALALAGCGGGGGGGSSGPAPGAPFNLAYSQAAAVYRTDTPIVPNTATVEGDPVTSWSVSPPLPAGLVLGVNGTISGSPSEPAAATDYVVSASNSAGSTGAAVNIQCIWHESKSLTPKAALTDADIRHFLDRTHFGFSQAHYDLIQQSGFDAYVDAITTFADTTQLESDARDAYLVNPMNDPEGQFPTQSGIAKYWLHMMMLNSNPFQENLALKWHDHFATATTALERQNLYYFVDHLNIWRKQGAGNLRTLLLSMARDPAMLVWLNGIDNEAGEPNENFGREWFELFCLGVDIEYTQQDIEEAARAFTGYRQRYVDRPGIFIIQFDFLRHDEGEKTVLGQTIPAQAPGQTETDDYEAMVDIVLTTNEADTGVSRVGQWIMRSLLRYFCYENPPQNVINELADLLRAGGWELKPVLMTLLRSEAFFSDEAREQFVKGPAEHVLGFMRATNLVGDPRFLDPALQLMGQRPTEPPSVDGWPGGTQWLAAQGMVDRANTLHYLTQTAKSLQQNLGITALSLLPTPSASAGEAVDAVALRLNVPLSAAERTDCVTFLDTQRANDGTVSADPFNPIGAPATAEDRLRDLLWILGQHPAYQIR